MKRVIAAVLCALMLAWAGGCMVSPATGERHFNVLSVDEEVSLGEKSAPEFVTQYGGEIPSPEIQTYVRDVGGQLAAVSERPDLPWEFFAVDSSVVNAFALPGGKVFITRGLLGRLNNEAMLAAVLGHEIGHVTDQHIGRQMSQAIGVQVVMIGLGVAAAYSEEDYMKVLGVGAQLGGGMYLLSFSRDQEYMADELGMRYIDRLGYNPEAMVQVMAVLNSLSDGSGQIEMLSTHPLPESRIERARKLLSQRYPDYSNPLAYTLNEARFQSDVLGRLKSLPAPKHTGKSE